MPSDASNLATFDESAYQRRTGSFSDSALPHKHVSEGLEWKISSIHTAEGREIEFDPDTKFVSLLTSDWDVIVVECTVSVPQWSFDIVDPGDPNRALRLGVTYWCRRTILRDSSPTISVDEPGEHTLYLSIPRSDVREVIKLKPALVRADSDGDDEQYATLSGHRMLEGSQWTIRVDRERASKNLLQPEEQRFSEQDDLPSEDNLVYVDFDHSPPKLYLNKDHERLLIALDSDARRGWDASVRDVAYDLIEAEFWPQVILHAAADITDEEGPEEPWKQGVIKAFSDRVYDDDTSYSDAVDQLREDTDDPQRVARLVHDIDQAIQSKFDSPSDFEKLLKLVDNR